MKSRAYINTCNVSEIKKSEKIIERKSLKHFKSSWWRISTVKVVHYTQDYMGIIK